VVTVGALLERITAQLTAAGRPDAAFDARCLLEDIGGIGRGRVDICRDEPLSAERAAAVQAAADRRASGYPLQYLLGEWDFLSLTLTVGEGVLIPRPDTETLCEEAARFLQKKGNAAPAVLDLCAGSGCVGLGIASLCPGARVTAVELSDEALVYLRQNAARYPQYRLTAVKADVLTAFDRFEPVYDVIASNPPYIPAADLPGLMPEVRCEPPMALDGGDGYRFYRVLASRWSRKLLPGGALMAEIGLGQAETVMALWRQAGFSTVYPVSDAAGIERVIVGIM
jgi:release factor glutamine methyltransferase